MISQVFSHIEDNKEKYLDELKKLVKQPSISTKNQGITECAKMIQKLMKETGITTKLIPTSGHPIIYGELITSESAPTIIFYGHYDVQPPEPYELWHTEPFEPEVKNQRLYGRGVGDNKGQLLTHILAVRSYLETKGQLPVNVKFVFEGEEEIGSPHIAQFVKENKNLLKGDLVYISDGPLAPGDAPVVSLGNRGILSVQLSIKTANRDNHSGNRGGVIPNAAWELVTVLNSLKNEKNKVLIPEFYKDVIKPGSAELDLIQRLPFDSQKTAEAFYVDESDLEKENFYKKLTLEPVLNINGIVSGYTGEGTKTIIPCQASAKLDMRLVPDQDPEHIFHRLSEWVKKINPRTQVEMQGRYMYPSRTSPKLSAIQHITKSVEQVHNTKPLVYPSTGGSLPTYVWTKILNLPAVTVPYANSDEANHAPNENLKLDLFYKGIKTSCQVLDNLSLLKNH
ncbi:M20/M25/M40 family metallo-hydrolase [Natranaerobius thermophilus]|uniref:Peptidase M20 n=1 Tax=Natranaerobius thermophilus (strain ATCC BAA-1301 / DSM 18059 / JW/NM-WN-LF) TaxID=457570 RepID=B2A0L6_NATTJ|nr:M20/M25/M40 family metallo-hydrolase [Natranaerobius thermophilus]ACB84577.1 peptidase M20 [Natranaerobius thermophilus JW/NM-WN-LF]